MTNDNTLYTYNTLELHCKRFSLAYKL